MAEGVGYERGEIKCNKTRTGYILYWKGLFMELILPCALERESGGGHVDAEHGAAKSNPLRCSLDSVCTRSAVVSL